MNIFYQCLLHDRLNKPFFFWSSIYQPKYLFIYLLVEHPFLTLIQLITCGQFTVPCSCEIQISVRKCSRKLLLEPI